MQRVAEERSVVRIKNRRMGVVLRHAFFVSPHARPFMHVLCGCWQLLQFPLPALVLSRLSLACSGTVGMQSARVPMHLNA